MAMLAFSFLALFSAPLIYGLLARDQRLIHILDGFIFISIGGLITLVIMPEAFIHGGWVTLIFMGLGLSLPYFSERIFHTSIRNTHLAALILGIIGLALHAITDGATLVGDHDHHGHALALGVILHRIPIGLTIWWLVRPLYGPKIAWSLLSVIMLGTILGYVFAPAILEPLSTSGFAMFQAFVAGSLFHVTFHRIHGPEDSCSHGHSHGSNWWEGFGNLLGAGVTFLILSEHNHAGESAWVQGFLDTLLELSMESAPALLLAYLAAGLATAFLPKSYVEWMSGGRTWKQSMRGVLVGLPLPVCSCGVVPLYHSLIKKGAPPAAAVAFLIATPELGIDAVLLSLPLLGGTMTGLRVVAAAVVALLVGIIIGRIAPVLADRSKPDHHHIGPTVTWREKLRFGLTDGLIELVDHTGPWILVGILVAAALHPVLQQTGFAWLPGGLEVPFFALLGMPLYVCASGATPLIAIFLASGVSPGAALAFLLTGPATNITTFGVLNRLHGRKIAILFGIAVLTLTVMLGYMANMLFPNYTPIAHGDAHKHWSVFHHIALALLVLLYLWSIVRRGARAFIGELASQGAHHHDHDHDHHDHHHGGGHDHHHHNHGHGHDHAHHGHGHAHHHHDHGHDHHDHGHHKHKPEKKSPVP